MGLIHELAFQHIRNGNWNFKFAWSIAACRKYGCTVSYPNSYWLWDYLENPPALFETEPTPDYILRPTKWEYDEEEEKWIEKHAEDFRNKTVSIALNYFFQSYKAFQGYEQEVYNFFQFNEDYKNFILYKYRDFFNKPAILLSVRLGDMQNHGDYYQIPHTWYLSALETEFPDWRDMNVVVTSDDIESAKVLFKDYPFLYAEPNGTHTHADNFKHYHSPKAIEHFVLGTLIGNYIIGQSTFSWWQAWLGTYLGGKVVHSGKVFSETGNMKHCNTENYYLPNWTKHNETN